jgi:lysozyme
VLETVLLLLLGLIAAGAWFVWLPGYRPGLQPGERYGVDISAHQGRVDWPALAHDDVGFAYIKATEGSTFVDRDFAANWAAAIAAGLAHGAYHFFSLCSSGVSPVATLRRRGTSCVLRPSTKPPWLLRSTSSSPATAGSGQRSGSSTPSS